MTDKERLVGLLREHIDNEWRACLSDNDYYVLADHLIANGVVVQKRGEWVRKDGDTVYWHECSECQELPPREGDYRNFTKFCPSCGAKMDLKEGK